MQRLPDMASASQPTVQPDEFVHFGTAVAEWLSAEFGVIHLTHNVPGVLLRIVATRAGSIVVREHFGSVV